MTIDTKAALKWFNRGFSVHSKTPEAETIRYVLERHDLYERALQKIARPVLDGKIQQSLAQEALKKEGAE